MNLAESKHGSILMPSGSVKMSAVDNIDCMMCIAHLVAGAPSTGEVFVRDGITHSTSRYTYSCIIQDALTCELYYHSPGIFWSFIDVKTWVKTEFNVLT